MVDSNSRISLPAKRTRNKSLLSFSDEEEGHEDSPQLVKKQFGKDPAVLTEFLPDEDRKTSEEEERKRLIEEYKEEQERIKGEIYSDQEIEVAYCKWDGSNNRFNMRVKKKCTIGDFLCKAREELASSYPEYKNIHHNSLIYVKEDFIIPFDYSFYDLLTNKAQGKNGPLIKLTDMGSYEKDEGYVAKILERRWYEKNKHIFPASKWELYDPLKNI